MDRLLSTGGDGPTWAALDGAPPEALARAVEANGARRRTDAKILAFFGEEVATEEADRQRGGG